MAVAKRQRKEKPAKMEQKKIQGPGVRTSVKQTALLASPIYIGQAQQVGDKHINGGSQDRLRPLLCSWPTLTPQGCTLLCLWNKTLSCNQAVTLARHIKSLL